MWVKWHSFSLIGLKVLWKKEKMLVTSTMFSRSFSSGTSKITIMRCSHLVKDFNPFPNKPWFLRVCIIHLLKHSGKRRNCSLPANFSFSHRVSYPFREPSVIFIKIEIVFFKLFHFEKV